MFNLSNKQYDAAKNLVTVGLPAAATLYAAMAGIWGFGYSIEVVGSASALATFLGVALKINTSQFAQNNTMVADEKLLELSLAEPGVTLSDITKNP